MTQAAEVEVDTQIGKVKVLKVAARHDCGRAINPMLVEGELEGSVVGGMGQALYEKEKELIKGARKEGNIKP